MTYTQDHTARRHGARLHSVFAGALRRGDPPVIIRRPATIPTQIEVAMTKTLAVLCTFLAFGAGNAYAQGTVRRAAEPVPTRMLRTATWAWSILGNA